MKTRFILYIALLFIFCHSQKDKVVQPDKPFAKKNAVASTDTLVPALVKDTNTIAKDPYKSGNYEFAKSADLFRQRFNNYMQKSGWRMRLENGIASNEDTFKICTMKLTDEITIVAKLNKSNGVVKVVLFGDDNFSVRSDISIVRAMKGMVAAGPAHQYITDDGIESILYRLGTLANDEVFERGVWRQDGVRYEIKVNTGKIYFGIYN